MKKKILTSLLMGAFLFASTSIITSCKDYDDDINDLKALVNDRATLAALEQAKSDLTSQIQSLTGQLQTATGRLNTLEQNAANHVTQTELNNAISGVNGKISDLDDKYAEEIRQVRGLISGLTGRLETAEGTLTNLTNLIGGKLTGDLKDLTYNQAVMKIWAELESVSSGLGNAMTEISGLQDAINKPGTGLIAVTTDLKQQMQAIKNYLGNYGKDDPTVAEQLQDLYNKLEAISSAGYDDTEILQRITTLENKPGYDDTEVRNLINGLAQQIKDLYADDDSPIKGDISTLKNSMETLSEKVNAINEDLNTLNVLIKQSLRSLVFIPDGYYHGIEATSFNYLEAYKFNIPAAAWNIAETRGYYKDEKDNVDLSVEGPRTDHNRYDSTKVALVEDLWANYHMNPSNVNIEDFTNVSLLTGDKWYENTRAANKADAGLTVKSYEVKDGDLKVQIDVKDPEQIKAVVEDYWAEGQERPMVTVFAAEVTLNKAGKDTTITSDYATLFADKMTGIRLAHVKTVPTYTGQTNTHCGACDIQNKDYSHLMATVNEAVTIARNNQNEKAATNAQDIVNYKETLDLTTLVETHYTTVGGEHKDMTKEMMDKFGLSYKFELTSLKLGKNVTDESAHAAILEDGVTFRPQIPRKVEENKYEQVDPKAEDIDDFIGENALQAVGRTPMVRVSLVDKKGNVLDYGYIRIEIVKDPVQTPEPEAAVVTYNGVGKTYQDVCPRITPEGYVVYETKWIQTEYDIYKNALGIDRETFEEHFKEDPVRDDEKEFQQYEKVDNKWVKLTSDKYIGVFTNEADMNNETHTQTSTLKWEITDEYVQKLYNEWDKTSEKVVEISRAVKYEDIHGQNAHYKDVYVLFTTTITFKPYSKNDLNVKVDWTQSKIAKYWYVKNTADMGTDEVHTNVPSVEDELRADCDSLYNLFSNEFLNNEVVSEAIVTGDAGFDYEAYKYRLVFDDANNGKEFKGASEKTYTLKVGADGRELLTTDGQLIAKLVLPKKFADKAGDKEEANYTMIEYQHSAAAHDLLNYASHNEFNVKNDSILDNYLNVIISLAVQNDNECKPIKIENGQFNVRFLRPIDVKSKDSKIEDASTDGKQRIYLADLVDFKDWRDAWKGDNPGGSYYKYYGIKGVKVPGLNDGDFLSDNHDVTADLNNNGKDKLYEISGQVDFKYHEKDGVTYLEYNNLSSTVLTFELEIPVVVEYIWGEFYTTATVTVDRTHHNAKKF